MIINNSNNNSVTDITKLLNEFAEKYRNIMSVEIDGHVFIYRALSRLEYKEVLALNELSAPEREELICSICTLYPEDYDFATCPVAGIPTKLAREIVEKSYVSDIEAYMGIIKIHRDEISNNLDAQIACVINEAFPKYDLEEIEKWDVDKTAKYLSRAEFILLTLRQSNLNLQEYIDQAQFEEFKHNNPEEYAKLMEQHSPQQRPEQQQTESGEIEVNLKGGKKKKIDLEELRKAQEKFPEIDWMSDAIIQEGPEEAFRVPDTLEPAFKTGYEHEEAYDPKIHNSFNEPTY